MSSVEEPSFPKEEGSHSNIGLLPKNFSSKPPNKHIASLTNVSKLFGEIELERDWREKELANVFKNRSSVNRELIQVEKQINELQQKKLDLETQLEKLSSREQDLRRSVDELDNKIFCIGEVSERFEDNVRNIKGDIITKQKEHPKERESKDCQKTLYGHRSTVCCVDLIDPHFVSCSADKTIKIWDLSTNVHKSTLRGHTGWVKCVRLYEDKVVSGSGDKTIRLWDIGAPLRVENKESCIATLSGHKAGVSDVQMLESTVVSGALDRTCKVWDAQKQAITRTLIGHTNYISCLQFYMHGLASGSGDHTIKIWDLRSGVCHRTFSGHKGPVTCVQFDDKKLLSGSKDNSVQIWDLRTGNSLKRVQVQAPVSSLKFDDSYLVVAVDKFIEVYHTHSFEEHKRFSGHTAGITSLAMSEDTLISGSYDNSIKIWSLGDTV